MTLEIGLSCACDSENDSAILSVMKMVMRVSIQTHTTTKEK